MNNLQRTVIPLMLLGDGQVGKTSLILRLTGNKFDDSLMTTIGKESSVYKATLHGHELKMKIWDTAGQERFKSMTVNVIKSVDGLILVYSIDSEDSFKNIDYWLKQLNDISDISKKPIIIVGNKSDLNDLRKVSFEEGESFARNHGYNFYEVSAKSGENVKEAFYDIFDQLYNLLKEEILNTKQIDDYSSLKIKPTKKKHCC